MVERQSIRKFIGLGGIGFAALSAAFWLYTEYRFGSDPISLLRYPISEVGSFQAGDGYMKGLRFSQDSSTLIAQFKSRRFSADKDSVRFWDVKELTERRQLVDNTTLPYDMALSDDEQRLAVVGKSSLIQVVDVASGEPRSILSGTDGLIHLPMLSSDGQFIVGGRPEPPQGFQMTFWDTQTGEVQRSIGPVLETIYAIAFSPSGDQLAFSSINTIYLWDLVEDKLLHTVTVPLTKRSEEVDIESAITSLQFSADGATIIAKEYNDNTVYIETATGRTDAEKAVAAPSNRISKASKGSESADSKTRLVTVSQPIVNIYDVEEDGLALVQSQFLPTEFPGSKLSYLWSVEMGTDNDSFLAYYHVFRSVPITSFFVGDVTSGQVVQTATTPQFNSSVLSPDGETTAAFKGRGGRVDLRNIKTNKHLREINTALPNESDDVDPMSGTLRFSPDGTLLFTDNERVIQLWAVKTGELLWTGNYPGTDDWWPIPSISRSNTLVFTICRRNTFCLLDADTGKRLRSFPQSNDMKVPSFSAISPDGKTLAVEYSNGRVMLWNLPTKFSTFEKKKQNQESKTATN